MVCFSVTMRVRVHLKDVCEVTIFYAVPQCSNSPSREYLRSIADINRVSINLVYVVYSYVRSLSTVIPSLFFLHYIAKLHY